MGTTNPIEATPGSIRGDLGLSVGNNLIHGSDSEESAVKELGIFFKKDDFKFKTLNTPVKNVFLGDLFDPCNGIASSEVKRLDTKINDNFLPYIRPTKDQRYSIDAYVDKNYIQNKYIFPKNTLYVSTDGQGSHS